MFEFDPAPPTTAQRIAGAVMLVAIVVPTISEWANLHWFGQYDC